MRALQGKEKASGPDHTSTLSTVGNLGLLYKDQGELAEAEATLARVPQGFEEALGRSHPLTLRTVANLNAVYIDQAKLIDAKAMQSTVLSGFATAQGSSPSTRREPKRRIESLDLAPDELGNHRYACAQDRSN